jgi:hypothetical protein
MDTDHQDERGAEPPAEGGREETPQEQRGEEAGQDPVSSPGPLGNPESDEETLSHRQQEQDPDAGDEAAEPGE